MPPVPVLPGIGAPPVPGTGVDGLEVLPPGVVPVVSGSVPLLPVPEVPVLPMPPPLVSVLPLGDPPGAV